VAGHVSALSARFLAAAWGPFFGRICSEKGHATITKQDEEEKSVAKEEKDERDAETKYTT